MKAPAKKQNGGPRNAPISFWQLPENLRNSFPAGKINVLVYAEAPSDRFVVMQGKRYLEGDALGQGFKVHRIEPARVVFSHRAYRFYMTQ
ncbi:MAG: general secretion pathway protein GspB [Xanthomonadales bacterium]|nr:general secretion pathway protein GspB [Xanthomonadales bacterium]